MGVSFLTPVAALFGATGGRSARRVRGSAQASGSRCVRRCGLEPACRGGPGACSRSVSPPFRSRRRRRRAARGHERAHGPAAKRRGGLHRARHLALDARVLVESGEPTRFERAQDDALALQAGAPRGPGRNLVAHRPCPPAPLPDGRPAGLRRDDARGRRHRAAAAVDVVRDERDDARRTRRPCRR